MRLYFSRTAKPAFPCAAHALPVVFELAAAGQAAHIGSPARGERKGGAAVTAPEQSRHLAQYRKSSYPGRPPPHGKKSPESFRGDRLSAWSFSAQQQITHIGTGPQEREWVKSGGPVGGGLHPGERQKNENNVSLPGSAQTGPGVLVFLPHDGPDAIRPENDILPRFNRCYCWCRLSRLC